MSTDGFSRKLAAILSADVAGYSRLMGADEADTVRRITTYRQVMTALVQQRRGRVVDSPGDNLLAEFPSIVDALQCAMEIQLILRVRNAQLPESRRMEFRIGVNLGDVIQEGERIYGDGVNIAARMEGLAEPGGVCVSGTVHEHTENKLSLQYDYLGEHTVKNIAEPVRVYRVLLDSGDHPTAGEPRGSRHRRWRQAALAGAAALLLGAVLFAVWTFALRPVSPPGEDAAEPTQALALPDAPSVAVLPFENMSGDPEQEYFSDGITEDLITDLSKVSGLFVIARNSTFVYKGQAADLLEVGRDLGVRYILEGSVRKANGTVRITAQLIDASTGGHLWAERYDRDLEDIFALQDEVAKKIVDALAVTLTADEQARLQHVETESLEAYDYVQRGWWYYARLTREDNQQARLMFQRAVDLDPGFADAYAGLGYTHYEEWAEFWSQDPQSLAQAFELATAAIALDDTQAAAHTLLSHVYLWRKQHQQAIAEQERAIALEPNNADGYRDMAEVLLFAGRPGDAIVLVQKAMRLNPHYPVTYPFTLGFAHVLLENYDDAIAANREALSLNPFFLGSHLVLAGAYSETGQDAKARAHMDEAVKINPQISLEAFGERLPFSDPEVADALLAPFREASLN